MSSTCNGFAITEGRRSFALMPAVIQCDNRHPADPRPLTSEQIAAIPGVKFPGPVAKSAPRAAADRPSTIKPKTPRTTPKERQRIVNLYLGGFSREKIADTTGRSRSSVREVLIREGVNGMQQNRMAIA